MVSPISSAPFAAWPQPPAAKTNPLPTYIETEINGVHAHLTAFPDHIQRVNERSDLAGSV